MKCPSCGAEQSDQATECSSCFIVFYKWKQQQRAKENPGAAIVQGGGPPPSAPASAEGETTLSWGHMVWVVLGLFLLTSAYFTFLAEGLPVPKDAYRYKSHGFALSMPPNWKIITKTETPVGGLTQVFDANADGIDSLRVLTGYGLEGALASRLEKQSAPDFMASIGESLTDLVVDSSGSVEVDRLKARRVVYSGNRTKVEVKESTSNMGFYAIRTTTRTPFEAPYKAMVVLVPGAGKGYYLVFSCLTVAYEVCKPQFEEVIKGFRVTRRPYSFSHIPALLLSPMGMGALVIAAALLRFL